MKSRKKAKEFIQKYMDADYTDISISGAKVCAIIAVDSIISNLLILGSEIKNSSVQGAFSIIDESEDFWIDVKAEIVLM